MKNLRVATMYVLWVHGTVACGSATSDPISGGVASGGNAGANSSGGSSANAGGGGSSSASGGASGSSGGGSNGTGGAIGGGGTTASGGSTATGGGSTSGGAGNAGGTTAAGGGSSTGGSPASGGAPGDAGTVVCTYVHPIVNGASRTCNSGSCYCSGMDSCYPEATASSCCKEPVVCGPGAQNPVATINHPGDGETRAVNVDIPFVGVGTDPQDGDLSGASLVWTSSLLGAPFGTGKTFNAKLPAGSQVITLTVTDSNSNTGTDTITLNIQ